MRRFTLTAILLVAIVTAAGCTRTSEEVVVERHRVDTEFIVE